MKKHTKGPWKVSYGLGSMVTYAINKSSPDIDETKANARLISAAPEMLEALELLVESISGCPEFVDAMKSHGFDIEVTDSLKTAKQAIKKAKGES